MKNQFPPVYYYAGKLRAHGWDIPSHIPNHARICETDVTYTQRMQRIGAVESVMSLPHCPPEKFQWYRPINQRVLVSRNRREGLYCGHSSLVVQHGFVMSLEKARHRRAGCNIYAAPLRNCYK